MTSEHSLDTYRPLWVLKYVAPEIWVVDGPEIEFRYLGFHMPFPTRMTVVRLRDGSLWLHSPIEPTGDLVDAVSDLGPVRHIVAPNRLHYWWVAAWADIFKSADVHLAPGLPKAAKRPLPPGRPLVSATSEAWAEEIAQITVAGDLFSEVVFFHRASRTLILTDLIENFEPQRIRSWAFRQAVRLAGCVDPDGKAPVDMRLTFLRHRRALREAVLQMLEWQPERVIIAHGRWYEANATSNLCRAFRWVL